MPPTDPVTTIHRLLALSKSANEHEAASAASAVARMLATHRLSLEEIEAARIVERRIVLVETHGWAVGLANTVAASCSCRLIVVPSRSALGVKYLTGILVGGVLDVEGAAQAIPYLTQHLSRLAKSGWRAHVQDMTDPRLGVYPSLLEPGAKETWQESFLIGAVEVVARRALRPFEATEDSTETALVPLDTVRLQAFNRATEYMLAKWPEAAPRKTRFLEVHLGGWKAGTRADVE